MGEGVNTVMQAALDLAARGFRVFPLAPNGKLPAAEGWQRMATTDPARIAEWWSARDTVIGFTRDGREVLANTRFNVGVLCGDGLLGLDADVKKGKRGIDNARALGVTFTGFVVRTPSGGLHEYLRGPDVLNSAGDLADGVDVRSAGGFLVGPGSTVDGLAYVLEAANDPNPVPPAVIHAVTASGVHPNRVSAGPAVSPDTPQAVGRSVEYLGYQAPLAVEGAAGDHTTFVVAATLKDYGVGEDMAVDLMAEHWNDRCSPPWDIDDLRLKVRNAYEYGSRPIGDLHPMADFAGVKLDALAEQAAPAPASRRAWFHHGDARGKVDWLYYGMLPKVGVGVLLAESQAGKTFLAIELARSLATGKPFFRETPDDLGASLFLFAGTEGSGLSLRLDALQEPQALPISATVIGNLSDSDALPGILVDLREEAARLDVLHGLPVRLIVLETMAASGLLNDENDNSEASRAMANLATIAREMNALVLTSHHPDKAGKGSRGASAIPNSADYVMEISREGNIRELELKKARDAEQRKLGTFTLVPVDLGRDERGRPITSMTISTGDVMSNSVRQAAHTEKFLEAVEWAVTEDGEEMPDGRRGVEMSLAKATFAERKGGSRDRSNLHKTFKAALGWCEQIARVEVVPYGTEKFLVLKQPVSVAA